jgi:hypothetical protein
MTVYKKGDRGEIVRFYQYILIETIDPSLEADGVFGTDTERAVLAFQRRHGLDGDGEIGPRTANKLAEAHEAYQIANNGKPKSTRNWIGEIVALALSKVGQREKSGNSGFWDAVFEKWMRLGGWFTGAAWCAFFARNIWMEVYKDCPKTLAAIKKTLGGGTLRSWDLARRPDSGFKTGETYKPGAIAYMKFSRSTGHAYIVLSGRSGTTYDTAEGNSNSKGGREGIEVAKRVRSDNEPHLLGYVYAPYPPDFGDPE